MGREDLNTSVTRELKNIIYDQMTRPIDAIIMATVKVKDSNEFEDLEVKLTENIN